MPRSVRKILLLVLGLVVLGALVYRFRGAITLEGFRWSLLAASVRHARISYLLLGIAGTYTGYAIRSLRWMRFSRPLGPTRFSHVFPATVMGFAALFVLGRVGEPVRPLLIARKDRVPVASTFGIWVLERVMDAAAAAVLAGLALLVYASSEFPGGKDDPLLVAARATGLLLLVGLLGVTAFLVYFRFHGGGLLARKLEAWHGRPGWHAKVAGLFTGFSDGLQAIRTWGDLLAALAYTAIHWWVIVWVYWWVAHSFGGRFDRIDFGGAMLLLAFTLAGSALLLPGVGGGTQVASFLVFTVVFGVEKEPAAAAAITLWLVSFAASCIVGLPLFVHEGWSMGELRKLARAEEEAEQRGSHVPSAGTDHGTDTPKNRGETPR
jgi:uncharacterized protein (TIRG00374 family)